MNEEIFTIFPKLETERIILREVNEEDLDLVFSFNADPDALRYVAREYYTHKNEAVDKLKSLQAGYHEKTGIIWTFVLKRSGESLGYGGFFEISENRDNTEVGYGILKKYWGNGYVSEVVKELTRFGFDDMDIQRIFGRVDPENIPSARILEKLGYRNEGIIHADGFARGRHFDMTTWARVKGQD